LSVLLNRTELELTLLQAGEAYDAPPDPLVVWGEIHRLPIPLPLTPLCFALCNYSKTLFLNRPKLLIASIITIKMILGTIISQCCC